MDTLPAFYPTGAAPLATQIEDLAAPILKFARDAIRNGMFRPDTVDEVATGGSLCRKPFCIAVLCLLVTVMFDVLPVDARATDIVDFKPSPFVEQTAGPFFYAIGDRLKFGGTISEAAPTLFSGPITAVYPSPDQKKAALVSRDDLYLAEPGKALVKLLQPVDTLAAKTMPVGASFYEFPTLQWSADSRSFYIVEDRRHPGVTAMSYSPSATLVRIDLAAPDKIVTVVPDFRSLRYFLVGEDGVCFDYARDDGSVLWKCADGGRVEDAKSMEGNGVRLADGSIVAGPPFLSYHPNIFECAIWLTRYGFSLKPASPGYEEFHSKDHPAPIFSVKTGINIKGEVVDGILENGCSVLPEGRYALLNVAEPSFTGQLLIDRVTGAYKELPAHTRVYRNLNSAIDKNVRIDLSPTNWFGFVPDAKFGTFSRGALP